MEKPATQSQQKKLMPVMQEAMKQVMEALK